MSNSAEVATAAAAQSPSLSLSEAQLSVFWAWFLSNSDAARRMARPIVSGQNVDDVVTSAALLFIESMERPKNPASFPKTEDEFRGRFLTIVRNYALDCVRPSEGSESPIHCHWGIEREPVVGGRKVADRPLDQVFARNDNGKYDAPAPAERRIQDEPDKLDQILRHHLLDLTPMQRDVVFETFFGGRKRAEVARCLGISVKTYDSHLQAAFRSMRQLLTKEPEVVTGEDRSRWYDLIEKLSERYAASRLRRASGKKGERSIPEGERPTHESESGKSSRASAA